MATSLAFALAELTNGVSFVEGPESNRYRRCSLIVNQLSLESMKTRGGSKYENVYWSIYGDWKSGRSDEFDSISNYIIYDNPIDYRPLDLIVCVVDSLPSKVTASKERVEHIKAYFGTKTIWVLNRKFMQRIKQTERFLGVEFDYFIPMENQENIYTAEFWGKPFQRTKLMSDEAKEAVKCIAKYVITLY